MSKLFYETIIDLIDTQVEHSLWLTQVETVGTHISRKNVPADKRAKAISRLNEIIEKCNDFQNNQGITDYLKDLVQKLQGEKQMSCSICNDTGIDTTGNNDLPCSYPASNAVMFHIAGVKGDVSGTEVKRHFLNDSPESIEVGTINNPFMAKDIPGRQ